MKTVEEKVKSIIADQLGVPLELVNPVASFVLDLGANELGVVELCMALENAFSISISDEEIEKITYVQAAIDIVKQKKG